MKDRRKSKWTRDDDMKLMNLADRYGENFDSLSSYFEGKSSMDLAIRYYKKIKHKKLNFSEEEDRLIKKLYHNQALNIDELETLQKKDPGSINHRLKSLLQDQDEEIRYDFNVSSTLSKIRIAVTKSSSRTDETNWSKDIYDLRNSKKESLRTQSSISRKKAQTENSLDSISFQTKRDFDAVNPFEKPQLFNVRHRNNENHSQFVTDIDNDQSTINYKKYSEDITFIEGISMKNILHNQPFDYAETNNSIANLFEVSDTGQLCSSMLIDSEAVDESLNFSHILDLVENNENYAEDDLNLILKDWSKDQQTTELPKEEENLRAIQTCNSKKENFEAILNRFNHLSCAMERQFYYKMTEKSKRILAEFKDQEQALLRQLIEAKINFSESRKSDTSNHLSSLKNEIAIQLKLIYLNKQKLDALSQNLCEK